MSTPLYSAINNSPVTTLAQTIAADATQIELVKIAALPAAPNIVTIGTDESAELVLYTAVSGNRLTGCTRGFNGTTPRAWTAGTKAYRAYTAYDHDTFKKYIEEHQERIGQLTEEKVSKSGWNAWKNLGTDENGNVVEKEDIFAKDTSAWRPVNVLDGVSWDEQGSYWDYASGRLLTTAATAQYISTSHKIEITPNCEYYVAKFRGEIAIYDATGTNGKSVVVSKNFIDTFTFQTNSEQVFLTVSFNKGTPGNYYTENNPEDIILQRTTMSDAEYAALPTRAESLLPFYGKKIVNFGDSIFGNRRPPDDISTELARLTGATVYNVGFGGCRMANHTASQYDAFSMYRLAYAVANNDWTLQDAAIADDAWPGSMPYYFPEVHTLLKSIDFNEIDIVTIAYGTNDFTGDVPIESTDDTHSTRTFAGALRYSIETLLTAYPHIKVFVCSPVWRFWMDSNNVYTEDSDTHTNSNGAKLPEFVEKTEAVAKEYHVPYIDNYYTTGFNQFNRSVYFAETDGTHPLTTGLHVIAAHMAKGLY